MRGRHAPSKSPPGLPLGIPATLDTETLTLYFFNTVLPRFQLLEEAPSVDPAEFIRDGCLQPAVLALSRAHFDRVSCRVKAPDTCTRGHARGQAIRQLRRQIETDSWSQHSAQQLVAASVMLCMLDGMMDPLMGLGDTTTAPLWHLKGGCAMIERCGPDMSGTMIAKDAISAHFMSIFATMDLMHALLSGDRPFFATGIWDDFADVTAWWGRLATGDRFLSLLKLMSEVAALGHQMCAGLPSSVGSNNPNPFLSRVQAELDAPTTARDGLAATPSFKHWQTFCLLYEVTTRLYILRALQLCGIDDTRVQDLVAFGINLLSGKATLPGMMAHCVIFPVLVLGAHAIQHEDQIKLLRSLQPTISYLAFGNLVVMRDWLQEIWLHPQHEATWWTLFRPLSDKVFLF